MKDYVSFSEMRLYFQDINKYYDTYILGNFTEANNAQKLGKLVHACIEDPRYKWLKEMRSLGYTRDKIIIIRKALNKLHPKRPPESEVYVTTTTKQGIKLLAIFDGLDKKNKILYEYKTSSEEKAWNQWRVDRNEQLSFYALVYHLKFHSFFKEIKLFQIDVKKGNVKTFITARGIRDMEYIEQLINQFVYELKERGWWELRLSKDERKLENNLKINI